MSLEEQKKQLYNRQEYVVGAETQAKYGSTSVLVVGTSGPGAEIIKNITLTGVKEVLIWDEEKATAKDRSTNFFLQPSDVGKVRSDAVAQAAKELNRFVDVQAVHGDVLQWIPKVQVVLFVNHPIANLVEANKKAREHQVKFVACESRGLCGAIFVDAGDSFEVLDSNGEETVSCVVTSLSKDGLVTMHEDKTHDCEIGSQIYFTGLRSPVAANSRDPASLPRGETPQLNLFEVEEVVSPYIVRLKDFESKTKGEPIDLSAGAYLHTTKKKVHMSFQSLEASLDQPEFFMIFDSEEKFNAPATLHAIFRAVAKEGSIPQSKADIDKVIHTAKQFHKELEVELAEQLLAVYGGDLNPMACFIGGMASQEALKVCSGKFTPLHQWLYYDARELLKLQAAGVEELLSYRKDADHSRGGQITVLGKDFQTYLAKQSAFIVGAGALGCELIKNAALIGLGGVSITDMDSIEISNLSRQFLFRDRHIGQSKAKVAGEAAGHLNPDMKITAYNEKMAPETEGIFNESFWNQHSVVLNALDNVASRKYVDERCLFYKKPLFESGTLGAKCNLQPVIPYVTESYGSSHDPPEKAIPLCTLKNFPSAIEHTIQWARDQFHLLFSSTPTDVNNYLSDPKAFEESLTRDPAASVTTLKRVNDALRQWPKNEKDCIRMARELFQDYFHDSFRQLLYNMPVDKRTEDGQLFWSGAKRPPKPQVFDPNSPRDADFVYHTACLLCDIYGLPPLQCSKSEAAKYAGTIEVQPFVARTITFATSEKDKTDPSAAQLVGDLKLSDLPAAKDFSGRRMVPLEFEKDDPTNHHVEFITYCSNTRAEAYSIPPADTVRTKRIAGKIIPAMVTTTSLVTGLVCFEMLKFLLLQYRHEKQSPGTRYIPTGKEVQSQLSIYRSGFVNIALPMIAFSDPILATGRSYALPDGGSVRWSIWDRLDIDLKKDVTVQELADHLLKAFHIDVFMITLASGKMIYTSFGKKDDKLKAVSVVAQEKEESAQEGNDYLNLIATGSIGDEDDVDIPIIRYKFRNF